MSVFRWPVTAKRRARFVKGLLRELDVQTLQTFTLKCCLNVPIDHVLVNAAIETRQQLQVAGGAANSYTYKLQPVPLLGYPARYTTELTLLSGFFIVIILLWYRQTVDCVTRQCK